jgi:tetratricopeptide (TPR) repeat protein
MNEKWLILLGVLLCVWSCTGTKPSTEQSHEASEVSQATDSLEARIEALNEEMEGYISEYENNRNEETFKRAMALNDSLERIDTTAQGHFYTMLTRSQLLMKAGRVKEAMRLQEQLLSKDPDNVARLQFYAGKYFLEERHDSMLYYGQRALAVCDKELAENEGDLEAREQSLLNKLTIYQLLNDRVRAREVTDQLQSLQQLSGSRAMTDDEFNEEFNEAREQLNQLAVAWRNDTDGGAKESVTTVNGDARKQVAVSKEKE